MYKKELTYKDLDGQEVKQDLYFNLSKRDAIKLLGRYTKGSLDEKDLQSTLDNLVKSKNVVDMVEFIEDFILSSYGEKSEDNLYFIKNKEVRDKFENSVAYAELFELLFTNNDELTNFIKGVFPSFKEQDSPRSTAFVVS